MRDTLRSLLGDLADDAPTDDLVDGRWEDARRRRRRSGTVVAGAALAASAAVVAGVALSGGTPTTGPSPAPAPAPTTEAVVPDGPDGVVAGHPAYLSPTVADEAILPEVDGGATRIDLSQVVGDASEIERATYAFAAPGSGVPLLVWLADEDGTAYRLEVPVEYGMALDENGTLPFLTTSLSPDGSALALVTRTSFAVYRLGSGVWQADGFGGHGGVDVPEFVWQPEPGANQSLIPPDHGQPASRGYWFVEDSSVPDLAEFPVADTWGPARFGPTGRPAQSGFATEITEVDAGILNPEVVAVGGDDPALLVLQGRGRFKGCCAVAGWLDRDRVVYESRAVDRMRLLSWGVRDGQFERVAEVVGLPEGGVVGSYADLGSTATTFITAPAVITQGAMQSELTDRLESAGVGLTSDDLNGLRVIGGRAIVDLDLQGASVSTSAQSQALWDALSGFAFWHPDIEVLEPRDNGSCERFGAAVEAGECLVITKNDDDDLSIGPGP